jgi:VIT1/CCC1 family predicted Fe2+/Mn2+ transporter
MSNEASWLEEKRSAWLYRVIAAAEPDTRMRRLFEALANAADAQSAMWKVAADASCAPTVRMRLVALLVRGFKPRSLRPILAAMKVRGLSAYDAPVTQQHVMPLSVNEIGVRHRGRGGNLRAAVFGVNDGLISNTSLLMGMAGAAVSSEVLVTSGVAGMLAGALSMAAGEYVSVRSQREMFEYQIGLERDEVAEYPDAEAEELALIYEARGVPLQRAREVSHDLMRNPQQALDVLAREELGLNPDDLGSPWGAATVSFVTFAAGACVPLVPFLLKVPASNAIRIAAVSAGVSLYIVGSAISLFSGRSAFLGGVRMLVIGAIAATVTYLIGAAV